MARYNRGPLLATLAVAAVFACTKSAPPTNDGKRQHIPQLTELSPSANAPADSCQALAKLYCENTPIDCTELEQLLRGAELPASACAEAVGEVEAILASLHGPQRDLMPMVLARYLPTVLLKSPKLSEEQRAKLTAMAAGPSAEDRATLEVDRDLDRVDVVCPGVSQPKGEMPPAGFERWCEREDGRRHGRALRWNENGERVREVEYRDGEAAAVRFFMPASQQLPPELFLCPSGHVERREDSGDAERRWCETQSGEPSGPAVSWVGGRVVSVAGDGMASMMYVPSASPQ